MKWNHRSELIIDHINNLKPDIICLQEVDYFAEFYVPKLIPQGYKGYFAPKLHSPCFKYDDNNGPDGVALFFKTDRYILKDLVIDYLLDETQTKGNQAVLLAVLHDKVSASTFIVAVTHLKAKSGFEDRRLSQTNGCIDLINKTLETFNNASVIWCADFNSEETELCHQAISQSKFNFKNAYNEFLDNSNYTYTTWKCRPTSEKKQVIDYVFYTSAVFAAQNILMLPEDDDIPAEKFPSFNHPSDHVSLCVDFAYNK